MVKLDPKLYMEWVEAPSTGHPVMFASSLVERMTCTEWWVAWCPDALGAAHCLSATPRYA